MPELPPVSVIVPVYNAATTIERCIQSLLDLDYPAERLELIAVDNASTDSTSAILERFGERICRLFEPKKGPAAARNRGLAAARGGIIAFTDADCFVDRQWVREIVAPLTDPTVGIVGGAILAADPGNFISRFGERIHDHAAAIHQFSVPYAITMNWASRRSVLTDSGAFDESFRRCEDIDLSYRIFQGGYRLVFNPHAIVHHRNEGNLAGLFREGLQHGFHSVRTLKKHRSLVEKFGHRRFDPNAYRQIGANLRGCFDGGDRRAALCHCVFGVGKQLGKATGSIRFGTIEL